MVIFKEDWITFPNILQETIIRADVLAWFCSDHSPAIFTITFESNTKRGKSLWKFNKYLLSNDEYINKLRKHLSESLSILDQNGIRDEQIWWEYIKSETRQFSITYSKYLYAERKILEKELTNFEKSGSNYFDNEDYLACKTKLDEIYDKKFEGLRIRSKYDWYEKGEKST